MTENTPEESTGATPECDGCGNGGMKLETRPVMVEGQEEPRELCSQCYDVLDGFGLIDYDRDREVFQYAQ